MPSNTMALDVGHKRIGVAIARGDINIAIPATTLDATSEDLFNQIQKLIEINSASKIIIGLPRGLDGQNTEQTNSVKEFAKKLSKHADLPIIFQDEALTSVNAEKILKQSNKPYQKSDIDALAASLILTDYLETLKVAK